MPEAAGYRARKRRNLSLSLPFSPAMWSVGREQKKEREKVSLSLSPVYSLSLRSLAGPNYGSILAKQVSLSCERSVTNAYLKPSVYEIEAVVLLKS